LPKATLFAWLLDPAESHGQGSLFLKAVLMDMLKVAPPQRRPLSPIDLDGEELRGVEIRCEWRNIDLLIRCEEPRFLVVIENKMHSGEREEKLQRYEDLAAREFPGWPKLFVFLNPDGDDPPDGDGVAYSFGDIHRVLMRCQNAGAGSIGAATVADYFNSPTDTSSGAVPGSTRRGRRACIVTMPP
jgi:hypothetical protein